MQRPDANEELSRRIAQTLREQPLERAPDTLIARVQREIALREAARHQRLPWWRQSLAHWPLGARLGFIAASLACALLLTYVIAPDASAWATRTADGLLARPAGALQGMSALLELLARFSRRALDAVLLLYGALFALLAVGHALLYGRARAAWVRYS
jgi:hypothetical protein